ncbi:hypothetical protein, variant 1 [Aphanomyces invadans]|uniref:EamA domain-containing protein n=1 Tax=Aphanomyces invadans TaxID=157072 RepID=A0A024TV98_9STRA|nr:hypothetical protein, variant 1 [Aphanomyces invadans]ETV97923.1 hypothetical protein, variant 1 [Aphanomyces invadans]|eukprot:XP_008873484.1 hypothetical protein, variant 1 [Aphanomyces invadans]
MQEHHRVLCLGQVISLFITVTSVCTQELTLNYNVHLATTQSVGNYLLLIGYLVYRWWMRDESSSGTPWWKYTLLAFADVEANFLVVLAYKYTTISSAMLLDCFTLPVVMFLSITFLHAKYSTQHYTGVGLCLFGICFLVVSDIINCKDASFTSDSFNTTALFGDALSLLGATIYGVSNVAQEYFVKTKSRSEFLGNLGLYGFVICGLQAYLVERDSFLVVSWSIGSVAFFTLYVAALFLMYSVTAIMLRDGDSAIFNMSLLTSDFFGVLAGIFLFHESLSWLYCVGFVCILAGLVVYTQAPPPTAQTKVALLHPDDACLRLLPHQAAINTLADG